MTNDSSIDEIVTLVGKVVMVLNESDLYVGKLENKSPLTLEAPYLLIKKDKDKMAIVPHTEKLSELEGKMGLYNEGNLGKNMRFLCYSPKDEMVLAKMIDGIYN
ncbi:hypothetical protein HOA91_05505 [Candidatus Woesearchaeota archaeon]|jgi:hypothetical protein|nr:hypothetical protein [Candidatus Woesearchaeota archaeon]